LQIPDLALSLLQFAAQGRLTLGSLLHRQAMICLQLLHPGKRLLMLALPRVGFPTEPDVLFFGQRHHHLGKRRQLAFACR
jgi:hypothetical protein